MTTPSIGALNTGPDYHLLDHIAPLADLLDIPLIVSEESNYALAKTYYPHVRTEYKEDLEFELRSLAERFDALIECKYWKPQLKHLFQSLHRKKVDLIFCPHGQSDKGKASPLLAPYAEQDIVLLYGDLLVSMLEELELWPKINRFAFIGDYRLVHYQKYKALYDEQAEREIFSLFSANTQTLLYAPTWQDADKATSFFTYLDKVLADIPPHWNVIVKVHPLLEQRNPAQYYDALRRIDKAPRTRLVSHFPPVHPILNRVDAYLGDFSSVGYDMLFYQKPMFFFPSPGLPEGRLRHCGQMVSSDKHLFSLIEASLDLRKQQTSLYRSAFRQNMPSDKIRDSIHRLVLSQ